MDSLVCYGSDDEGESGRYGHQPAGGGASIRRREDDTNYDDVNMDMSEESEPELPPAAPPPPPAPRRHPTPDSRHSSDSRERDRSRSADRRGDKRRDRDRDRERERERERPRDTERSRERNSRERKSRERRSPRRDERYRGPRRGLLGDCPDDRGAAPQPPPRAPAPAASDARDAVSPRFIDQRDRRDRDRERDRERERDRDRDNRPGRRSEERRGGCGAAGGGSAPRGAAFPPPHHHAGASERETPGDYRPSSYKVNKKLEVMEKMGLQIKTPDGSMATARQLRAATQPTGQAAYAIQSHRALDQVQKRKLLWAHKGAGAAEAEAARWSGARFAQDADGKQVNKFMRLMGIKEPAAVRPDAVDATEDPNKKQEELFQAMQQQYEVARATTHTMRGVGLGFQRGNL